MWATLEPVERHVDWMADAQAIRFRTAQTRGVGTQFDCDTRVGPLRLTDRMEITEWEPGRAMGVRHSGVVSGSGRFTLEPDGSDATRFAWNEELRFPWWLGGRLGELVGGKVVLRLVWRRNLKALKRLVEQGGPGAVRGAV